ncbi:MAG: hypothetical protein WC985_11210, partial [Thermoplasmata archaeon]
MQTARRANGGWDAHPERFLLVACVAVLFSGVFLPMVARAPPPIPMVVQGHAYDGASAPLPIGTPIRAFLDGVDYSNNSQVQDTAGSYSVMIAGNWMLSQTTSETPTIKEGPNFGETVQFVAGNVTNATFFQEILSWSPGTTVPQDLHLGSAAKTPGPLTIQGVVTQPARGGNQYAFLCNPTSSSISLYDYFLEI